MSEQNQSLLYAMRGPLVKDEPVVVRREEPSRHWHARGKDGTLIAKHQYRNDLMPGLKHDGFSPTLIE